MEFNNLKAQYNHLKSHIDTKIQYVLEDANFIMGDFVEAFESELAEYVGVKHVISCASGTDAMQLIYMAYGIGSGDAVFCPDMTFIASVEPACLLGATPVFCDIDKDSYNIDVCSLERQIRAVIQEGILNPKAVIAVDFVGNPADYDGILAITKKYNLLLIEDAAQGMGAECKGRKCGTLGDIAATSFFPSKPLGCYGDGGAVFTESDEMNYLLRSYRVHGRGKDKYDNIRIGINSRMDTLQAAILQAKLKEFPFEIVKRQEKAEIYTQALKNKLKVSTIKSQNKSSYAQYILLARNETERQVILTAMKDNGIPTILYYPTPMHQLPVFKALNQYGEPFINTSSYSERAFGIPFSPYITEDEQDRVIEVMISAMLNKGIVGI